MTTELNNKIYEGYWYLPSNPGEVVVGTLSINQRKGIKLKTIGSLIPRKLILNSQIEFISHPILWGEALDGTAITLVSSNITNWEYKDGYSRELSTTTYSSLRAICGKRHFDDIDSINFNSADIRLNLLDEWICKSGFNHREEVTDNAYSTRFITEYEYPDVTEAYIDSIDTFIKTNYLFGRKSVRNLNWELTHKSYFSLQPNTLKNLEWYLEIIDILRKFLSVVTGFPCFCIEFVGYGHEQILQENVKYKEEFQVYVRMPSGFIDPPAKHPSDLLINLTCIKDNFEKVLKNWFSLNEKAEQSILLYVATLSINLGYSEFQFLNYIQALEAFHKRTSNDKKSNLRKRVESLLNEVWDECLSFFIIDDKESFIDKTISTRNSLVHSDEKNIVRAIRGSEIFYYAGHLRILLLVHFLLYLDLSKEEVFKAIKKFVEFNYLKKHIQS